MKKLDAYHDLFLEKKAFMIIGIMKAEPHMTPVWFDTDEESFRNGVFFMNTAVGRVKERRMQKGIIVGYTVMDPDNPYRYNAGVAQVVNRIEGEEAEAHIDDLMFKYQGRRPYAYREEGEQRVKMILKILKVIH